MKLKIHCTGTYIYSRRSCFFHNVCVRNNKNKKIIIISGRFLTMKFSSTLISALCSLNTIKANECFEVKLINVNSYTGSTSISRALNTRWSLMNLHDVLCLTILIVFIIFLFFFLRNYLN